MSVSVHRADGPYPPFLFFFLVPDSSFISFLFFVYSLFICLVYPVSTGIDCCMRRDRRAKSRLANCMQSHKISSNSCIQPVSLFLAYNSLIGRVLCFMPNSLLAGRLGRKLGWSGPGLAPSSTYVQGSLADACRADHVKVISKIHICPRCLCIAIWAGVELSVGVVHRIPLG